MSHAGSLTHWKHMKPKTWPESSDSASAGNDGLSQAESLESQSSTEKTSLPSKWGCFENDWWMMKTCLRVIQSWKANMEMFFHFSVYSYQGDSTICITLKLHWNTTELLKCFKKYCLLHKQVNLFNIPCLKHPLRRYFSSTKICWNQNMLTERMLFVTIQQVIASSEFPKGSSKEEEKLSKSSQIFLKN